MFNQVRKVKHQVKAAPERYVLLHSGIFSTFEWATISSNFPLLQCEAKLGWANTMSGIWWSILKVSPLIPVATVIEDGGNLFQEISKGVFLVLGFDTTLVSVGETPHHETPTVVTVPAGSWWMGASVSSYLLLRNLRAGVAKLFLIWHFLVCNSCDGCNSRT